MSVRASRSGAVGQLVLDRPDRAHAYDRAMLDALLAAANELATNCTVIVVSSTGQRAFCGGADLRAMPAASPLDALDLWSQRVFTAISRLPAVSIAALQGPAVAGGCELALACDLRVVGPRASFSLPETRLGILPSAGGTTRLARLVGVSRAKALILGGDQLDAPTALAAGLANRLAEDPLAEALAWAEAICLHDPAALRLAKATLDAEESAASLARERTAEAILYSRRPPR